MNYNDVSIEKYNKEIGLVLDDIRDFISLHYISDRDDSDFWKDQKNVPLPKELEENLSQWKHRLPVSGDFRQSNYKLFDKMHYILVMHGLGLFNQDSIKQQYSMIPSSQKEYADRVLNDLHFSRENYRTIPHKDIIRLVRTLNA